MAKNSDVKLSAGSNALRNALAAGQFVVAPGCYDSLSARLAESHGCGAVYMSGLGVTASLLALAERLKREM